MPAHSVSFKKMRSVFFFSLIAILTIAMLILFRPFFYPIFWAAVISVMFYPMYQRILKATKLTNASVTLTLLAVILILLLPLAIVSTLLVKESLELYSTVTQSGIFTQVDKASNSLQGTVFDPYVEVVKTEWRDYAENATQQLSVFLFNSIRSITQNILQFIFMLFIMFYSLFYFLRDGKKILHRLMELSPLGSKYEKQLYDRFTSTTRATLKSTLIVGGIQGTLGGILFLVTGIEGAFVWAIIMIALSIIPAVGSFIVWFPAGIIMLALGNVWQGVIILVVGALVISTIDNFLRPPLVGKDAQMHPLVVLFSTLGGLIIFGISGFVIGPVIAALYLSIISVYEQYYGGHLLKN